MNSIAWNENKKILQDTIIDYCNEELIQFDKPKQELFENTLNYFKDKIHSVNDIKNVNMQVLQHFVKTVQDMTQQTKPQLQQNHPQQPQAKRPQEIYSREEIIEARNKEFQNKFSNAQQEFAGFKLKKPEEIDFSDKNNNYDDDISIDKRIEMELQQRQYDIENSIKEPPKEVDKNVSNPISSINDKDKNKTIPKKVSFENIPLRIQNKLKKNNTQDNIKTHPKIQNEIQKLERNTQFNVTTKDNVENKDKDNNNNVDMYRELKQYIQSLEMKITDIEDKYDNFNTTITKYGNIIKNTVDDTKCIIELYICDDIQESIIYNKNPNISSIALNYIEVFNNDIKPIYSVFKNCINMPNILHMDFNKKLYNCYLKNTSSITSNFKLNDNIIINGKKNINNNKTSYTFNDINAVLTSYNKKHLYQPSIVLYDSINTTNGKETSDISDNIQDNNDLEKRIKYYTCDDMKFHKFKTQQNVDNNTSCINPEIKFYDFQELTFKFNIDDSIFEILLSKSLIDKKSVNIQTQEIMDSLSENAIFLKLNTDFNGDNLLSKFNFLMVVNNTTRELYNVVDFCYLTEDKLYRTSEFCNEKCVGSPSYNTLLLRHNHTFKDITNSGNNRNDNNIKNSSNVDNKIQKIYLINPLLLYYSEI